MPPSPLLSSLLPVLWVPPHRWLLWLDGTPLTEGRSGKRRLNSSASGQHSNLSLHSTCMPLPSSACSLLELETLNVCCMFFYTPDLLHAFILIIKYGPLKSLEQKAAAVLGKSQAGLKASPCSLVSEAQAPRKEACSQLVRSSDARRKRKSGHIACLPKTTTF